MTDQVTGAFSPSLKEKHVPTMTPKGIVIGSTSAPMVLAPEEGGML